MDGDPGPKRRFLIVVLLFFPVFVRGEIYDSFRSLPITRKIYVRNPAHEDWATSLFYYPKYVRITRTWSLPLEDSIVVNEFVYYMDAESPLVEHEASWVNFNYRYNEL